MVQRYSRVAAVAFVVVASFLVRERTHAQSRVSNDFVFTHVRVFDGARTLQNTQVAVTGGLIREIGGDLASWGQLPVIDGTGLTLVPGLIDAHTHVRDAEELRQALRFGVTTMLDMGATEVLPPQQLFALRAAARITTDMSDLRAAGYMAVPPAAGFPTPAVSTVEEAKQFVAMRRAEGSDYLKIGLTGVRSATRGVANLDEPMVRALVEAAHANGMLAVAHVETLDDVTVALSAGVDGLMHVWRRGGANAQIARRVAERGVFVSATLVIPDGYLDGRAGLLADPRFLSVLSNPIKEHLSRSFSARTTGADVVELRASLDAHLAAVRSLHEAGARLLIGTDASRNSPSVHGISLHREMELFSNAGLSPSETLTAATASSAEAFRLADRGRILPGRRADLLLVRGDPTSDLLSIRDIVRIWKSGVEVDRTVTDR